MKKKFTSILIIVFLYTVSAVAQNNCSKWEWASNITKEYNINSGVSVKDVCIDNQGNSYAFGEYRTDSIFFGNNVTLLGDWDHPGMFLTKYDNSGNALWANQIIGSLDDADKVVVDDYGSVYVLGHFSGDSLHFGSLTIVNQGEDNIFFAKYDGNGNFVWAKRMGSIGGFDFISDAKVIDDNIYITGNYKQASDVQIDTILLSASFYQVGFFAKFNLNGDVQWVNTTENTNSDQTMMSIDVDLDGNIFITGYYKRDLTLDTIALPQISFSSSAIFVARYNSSGDITWAKTSTNIGNEYSQSIVSDNQGNCYIAGYFREDTLIIDGEELINTDDYYKYYYAKFNYYGQIEWLKSAGSTNGGNYVKDVQSLRHHGDYLFFHALFEQDTVFFAQDTIIVASSAHTENWVMKIEPANGNLVDTLHVDGTRDQYHGGFDLGTNNQLIIGGAYLGSTISFNTDTMLEYTLTNNTPVSFVALYNNFMAGINPYSGLLCNGDSIELTANSGTYSYQWLYNSSLISGADSQNLFVSQDGNYQVVIDNGLGCIDTSATCIITLGQSTNSTQNISICQNDSIFLEGSFQTTPGTYYDTLLNSAGCDSVVITTLSVNTVDTSLEQNGTTLTAYASGAIYQWIDCNSSYTIISGEIAQSFTATVNGNYAVEITDNGCVDTSACYSVTTVGLQKNASEKNVSIYPNPTSGIISIEGNNIQKIEVVNINGQILKRIAVKEKKVDIDLSKQVKGSYLIKAITNKSVVVKKVMVE